MEITSKFRERENQSPLNSPSSHGSSTTTSTCSTPTPQPQPIPITRSDPNSPYPTTFVTADTSSFKQVVQMLTGSSDSKPDPIPNSNPTQNPPSKNFIIPPVKTTAPKKQGFKLYERRNSLKHMMISPLTNQHASFSPRYNNNFNSNVQEILSPSLLDFPSLTLSPVTPLVEDPFNKSSPSLHGGGRGGGGGGSSSSSEEERAIAEKGFYLHPSPRDSEPRLLPLFPLSSPRMSGP